MEAELNLDPDSNHDPDPKLIKDPDPDHTLQIISDPDPDAQHWFKKTIPEKVTVLLTPTTKKIQNMSIFEVRCRNFFYDANQ